MTQPTTLHPRKQLLFALLSVADFALTWWLLRQPDAQTYEANPVANFWLVRFGWTGLACFKAVVVCVVLGLAAVITRSRPHAAGRVLQLGCACLALVVAYSAALAGQAMLGPESDCERLARANAEFAEVNHRTAAENKRKEPFRARLAELRASVVAHPGNLREAAERLEEVAGPLNAVRAMQLNYPDSPREQQLACWLISHAVASQGNDLSAARQLARRLYGEFQSAYGAVPPPQLSALLGAHAPHLGEADSARESLTYLRNSSVMR